MEMSDIVPGATDPLSGIDEGFAQNIANIEHERAGMMMRNVVDSVSDVNPDYAAKLNSLSMSSGIPVSTLRINPNVVGKLEPLQNVGDLTLFAKNNPITTQMLSNPNFAAVAHNDILDLARLEGHAQTFHNLVTSYDVPVNTPFQAPNLPTPLAFMTQRQAQQQTDSSPLVKAIFNAVTEIAGTSSWADPLQPADTETTNQPGVPVPGAALEIAKQLTDSIRTVQQVGGSGWASFLSGASGVGRMFLENIPMATDTDRADAQALAEYAKHKTLEIQGLQSTWDEGSQFSQDVKKGASAFVAFLPSALAAVAASPVFAAEGMVGLAATFTKLAPALPGMVQMMGDTYNQMREFGKSPSLALADAVATMPLQLAAAFPLTRIAKAFATPGMSALRAVVTNLPAEFVGAVAGLAGMSAEQNLTDEGGVPWGKWWEGQKEEFPSTATQIGTMILLGGVLGHVSDTLQRNKTDDLTKMMQKLGINIDKLETLGRMSPENQKAFAQTITKNQTVWIDPDAMAKIVATHGLDLPTILPDVAKQMIGTGTPIEVPLGDLLDAGWKAPEVTR